MPTYTRDEVLLSVHDITQRYGDVEVLSHVSVDIHNLRCSSDVSACVGQVVAFLGPSGSGKTQLLRIIAGLQEPTSGLVAIDPEGILIKRGMAGVVFQRYPLFNHRTVMGNLLLAGKLAGMDYDKALEHSQRYLAMFELAGACHKYPGELSGGMQQRVAICQQLINMDGAQVPSQVIKTRLLLMDEPFAALDHRNTKKTCKLIRQVADMNDLNTIIVVTHDIHAALCIGDIVWVMGRDRDANGQVCSGGKIVKEYDLVNAGLTWQHDIDRLPAFSELQRELSEMFDTL